MLPSVDADGLHTGPPDGRLSVLAITSELPWPLNTGGHIRSYHLLKALARRFSVRLVTGCGANAEEGVAALGAVGVRVRAVPRGQHGALVELAHITGCALQGRPYVLFGRHDRRPLRRAFREALGNRPDVLYLDHLDSFPFASLSPGHPTVLDMHNVYSSLVARTAEENGGIRRIYLRREARLLATAERTALAASTEVLAVSAGDAATFARSTPCRVRVVPNGVDCAHYEDLPTGRPAGERVVLYVGAMSWQPNVAAVEFLSREVLPEVRRQLPDACVRVVGKDPPDHLRKTDHLDVLGEVPDVRPHLLQAQALAVPLEAGGGTRLKILEAFAAGLPVISTPVGCEGIDCVDGEHLIVADRRQFAEKTIQLLSNPDLAARLAAAARRLVRERYDWTAIGVRACEAVTDAAHRGLP
jgi:glycosyltransferase involved in cell wall biosynthesis